MSDNYLRLIPMDPTNVPKREDQRKARAYLATCLPSANSMTVEETPDVCFVDAGANLESISCPACGSDLDMGWWMHAMDEAYKTQFINLRCVRRVAGLRLR